MHALCRQRPSVQRPRCQFDVQFRSDAARKSGIRSCSAQSQCNSAQRLITVKPTLYGNAEGANDQPAVAKYVPAGDHAGDHSPPRLRARTEQAAWDPLGDNPAALSSEATAGRLVNARSQLQPADELKPYFFSRSMSALRLRPNRRAVSDWLPPLAERACPIRLRSNASSCSLSVKGP